MSLLEQFYSNQTAKQTLVNFQADGRLPHALLLEGENGCGKTHFARLIACSALCQNTDCPCGVCRSCRLIQADQHPDVSVLSPDDDGKPYSVAKLRELVASCYVRPNDGEYSIYILRNIDQMSEQSQNTLLKIMEEPPPHVLFVCTCQSRTRVLTTILSRMVCIPITPCSTEECVTALEKQVANAQEDWHSTCQKAAQISGGNIGRALQILQDERLSAIFSSAQECAVLLCKGSEFDVLCHLQRYQRKKEDFLSFLSDLRQIFVTVLKQKNGGSVGDFLPDGLIPWISALQAMKIIDIIDMVYGEAYQNVSVALSSAHLCSACKQVLQAKQTGCSR